MDLKNNMIARNVPFSRLLTVENLHDVSKKLNSKSSWVNCKMSNSSSKASSHWRVCGSL